MSLRRSVKKRGFPKASLGTVLTHSTESPNARKSILTIDGLRSLARRVRVIGERVAEQPDAAPGDAAVHAGGSETPPVGASGSRGSANSPDRG